MLTNYRNSQLFVVLIVLLVIGCAPRPDSNNTAEMARVFGECSFNLNTRALGLSVLPDTDTRVMVIQDIVDNLVTSRYAQFPWAVKTAVLDNPAPNAFTTGGGYLAAFSGVYAMSDNEAALAGVIAHELAHMEKLDPMELAGYLEEMLAQQLMQDGIDDYDVGQALSTVVDFCLAIPGLVSVNWKQDINTTLNTNTHSVFGDAEVPYVPFTFSDNPESRFSPQQRDPDSTTRVSSCNNKLRESYDEFVVINPEYYLDQYPNAAALPDIPDDITSGPGGLPGVQSLWSLNPWVAFQHTAFARYAECQSDEAGMLNLFASGYNPLALNSSFQTVLDLFSIDEQLEDFRFQSHPALGQRIEDNREFINSNTAVLPSVESIEDHPENYANYIVMAERVSEFEALRDNAREAIVGKSARSNVASKETVGIAVDYEPITVADIAVLVNKELDKKGRSSVSDRSIGVNNQCAAFERSYQLLTGKVVELCK